MQDHPYPVFPKDLILNKTCFSDFVGLCERARFVVSTHCPMWCCTPSGAVTCTFLADDACEAEIAPSPEDVPMPGIPTILLPWHTHHPPSLAYPPSSLPGI